ncbi:MAG: protein-tyrosine phosphatase [Paracoccaceae bacterium]|jgi:protein-tyrosine phosphatase
MAVFSISEIPAGPGRIGICPIPGRYGVYRSDIATVQDWCPDLVLTMTEMHELTRSGAANLPGDLAEFGCDWLFLPIIDLEVPTGETLAAWPAASIRVQKVLAAGGRVLVHCYGGCGRSGMLIVRILAEMGEPPEVALARLRTVRGCAVETETQMQWAVGKNGS